jgi:cellulose synthase/poly-beta-1,6-N-acetylglucosamine synthase-like glycosyltransferase
VFGITFWLSVALIIYAYAGYPLLIFLFARFGKPLKHSYKFQPTISLIFAANNEERMIGRKLKNCLSLDYPRNKLQIIVADDGSTDATAKIVKEYANQGIELFSFPQRRGKLSALNDAVKSAWGEVLLFSDADNFYPPNVLIETAKCFADPSVGAVSGGRDVVGAGPLGKAEGLYWKYEEFIKTNETRLGNCIGVAGDLLAVRKSLFTPPPANIINDDFYMALSVIKKGYRVVYAPEARSSHPVAAAEQGEIERRARMIAGRYQAMFLSWQLLPFSNPVAVWQIISHKFLRPLVPFAMILAFVTNFLVLFVAPGTSVPALLFLSAPYGNIIFIGQIIFYLLAAAGIKYRAGGIFGHILYLPTFLVNSNLAALIGLYRYVGSRQTVLWSKSVRS